MDNELKIVSYLGKHLFESFTLHQLSILLSMPYASFYRTIPKLESLVTLKEVGRAKTVTLNLENPLLKSYLAIAEDQEAKEYLKKVPIIQKIAAEMQSKEVVLLFGSYAKYEQTEKSDIDLLVINKKGSRSLSFSKYELLYKKKINPIFLAEVEFKMMLREAGENVGKQALKSHIVLNGPQGFWELVLDGL